MQNSFIFLRSLSFYLISIIWMLLLTPFALTAIIFMSSNLLLSVSKLWAKGVVRILEFTCGLYIKVSGLKNISKQPVIIAAKHQSALETLYLYSILDEAKYILKDSLRFIPILGLCFSYLNMIFIDRSSAVKSIRQIKDKAGKLLTNKKSVIIFPEGTRVTYGKKVKYNPGVAALYELNIVSIIPVALNSGKFWPKNSIMKYPGVCHIKFLPPIKSKLNKQEFMQQLEKAIEETKL